MDDFDFQAAERVLINKGGVKCIWVEECYRISAKIDGDGTVWLEDGGNGLIELDNGTKILVTNSEWGTITVNEKQ